jgi:hypothetical protein
VGLQLVYFINESKSMVDLNFNLVKMEPNRVVELSVVNQSLLGQLCLIISADNKFKSENMIYVVTVRQEVRSTATNLTKPDLGLKVVNESLVAVDLIPLELGKSNRIRMVWKPGLVRQSARKHRKEGKNRKMKDQKTGAMYLGELKAKGKRKQNDSQKQFGPEYSSDNAGDGPVGKTVGKRNREKAIRMQSKESWHTMETECAEQPAVPVDEWTKFVEMMAGCKKEEISPAIWKYVMKRVVTIRTELTRVSTNLISGVCVVFGWACVAAVIVLVVMSRGFKKIMNRQGVDLEKMVEEEESAQTVIEETMATEAEHLEAEPKEKLGAEAEQTKAEFEKEVIDTDAAGAELKEADETKSEKVEPEVMMRLGAEPDVVEAKAMSTKAEHVEAELEETVTDEAEPAEAELEEIVAAKAEPAKAELEEAVTAVAEPAEAELEEVVAPEAEL